MICCSTTYADYTIKNISNICKYPHHIKEKKKQIIRLLFLFLVLERILANVLVESCIAIGFHLRQLREAFLVNKAYFMAIGIGQNEYSNRCLAGRIQRDEWFENCAAVGLHRLE